MVEPKGDERHPTDVQHIEKHDPYGCLTSILRLIDPCLFEVQSRAGTHASPVSDILRRWILLGLGTAIT
jgi:hypothetical protein